MKFYSVLNTAENDRDVYNVFLLVNDDAVGSGTLNVYKDDNTSTMTNLVVGEEHRRKGYSKNIQEYLEQIAKDRGCVEVYLYVESISFMRKLYEERGYVYHSEYHSEGDEDGKYPYKMVWLKKKIIMK
jgi:GNAT superfamily N-acetyltransferase